MGMSEISIKAGALSAVLREVIHDDDEDYQVTFLALSALAAENALLMQRADPAAFEEFGGIRKWVHDMVDTALTEVEHAMVLRGQLKN